MLAAALLEFIHKGGASIYRKKWKAGGGELLTWTGSGRNHLTVNREQWRAAGKWSRLVGVTEGRRRASNQLFISLFEARDLLKTYGANSKAAVARRPCSARRKRRSGCDNLNRAPRQ